MLDMLGMRVIPHDPTLISNISQLPMLREPLQFPPHTPFEYISTNDAQGACVASSRSGICCQNTCQPCPGLSTIIAQIKKLVEILI